MSKRFWSYLGATLSAAAVGAAVMSLFEKKSRRSVFCDEDESSDPTPEPVSVTLAQE